MQPLNKPVAGLLCSTAHDIPLKQLFRARNQEGSNPEGPHPPACAAQAQLAVRVLAPAPGAHSAAVRAAV